MAKTRSKKSDNQDIRQQFIDAITAVNVDLVRDLIARGAVSGWPCEETARSRTVDNGHGALRWNLRG